MNSRSLAPTALRTASLSLALGCASLAAQTSALLPSMAATPDGIDQNFSVLSAGSSGRAHIQALYATSDIAAAPGTVQALRLRSVHRYGLPAVTAYLRIEMSTSPVTIDAPQTTFAANHGIDRAVVFDGSVSFPAIPANTTFPPASLSRRSR